MRMIVAVIQPTKLRAVQDALARLGVDRLSVCDGLGFPIPAGKPLPRKAVVEICVNEDFLDRTLDCLTRLARTASEGAAGDGRIFVLPVEEVVRLSDAVRGPEAVS
jgi:nitrogen regulatory protein PII